MGRTENYRVDSMIEVQKLYETSVLAIYTLSNQSTVLIKRKNWVAACFHECLIDFSQISSAFQKHGYETVISLAWNETDQLGFVVPTDEGSIAGCFVSVGTTACIFFEGEPDWVILYERTLDYLIICGEKDFVEEVLGCSINEAFESIEEVILESRFISDIGKGHFKNLLYQLRVIYPQAKLGDKIIFEFP